MYGIRVADETYSVLSDFHNGLALIIDRPKWGFINRSKEIVIPLIYENADSFSGRLAPVKLNGKWGFINTRGKVVIPFKYDDASRFDRGFSIVQLGDKKGLINKKGEEVIPLMYDRVFIAQPKKSIKGAQVHIKDRYLFIDLDLNYYDMSTGRKEKLNCGSCERLNDKLVTGLCCRFFK